MLRPWLVALALVVCALISLTIFAWRVDFSAPEVVAGLAEAAADVRLTGIAMSLRQEAAEMRRAQVRRLRDANAGEAVLTRERFALADELRDAALLAESEGDLDLAREWMAASAQAAPERADLRCLLTDVRAREAAPEERRMAFLRLVYEHDAPCANLLAGESFLDAGDSQAARAYLERAVEKTPKWAEPRLAMARMEMRANDPEAARRHAARALATATDLRTELGAASLLRSAGGAAPARWRLIARWAWQSYAYVLPSVAVFLVLVFSPAIVRLIKRGVNAVRSQRSIAESAS
ncbi:MAG: hypothetical protein ACOCX2_00260 [Armatimonadota bacterium]